MKLAPLPQEITKPNAEAVTASIEAGGGQMEKEEEEEDGEGGDVNSKKLVLQPLPTVKGPNSMQNIEYSLSFFHIFSLSFSFSIYIYT